MKTSTFFAIAFFAIIFSCGTEKGVINDELNSFKLFTDSLFTANTEYLKGVDTVFVEGPSENDPAIVIVDTIISNHTNIFDTTNYMLNQTILPTLEKYNSMEQHLDSAKAQMDVKTLELFESIKQKMNEIKQPIK